MVQFGGLIMLELPEFNVKSQYKKFLEIIYHHNFNVLKHVVKVINRKAIDVTLDFISDNFNRTPNRMWSDCDYDSSWIR